MSRRVKSNSMLCGMLLGETNANFYNPKTHKLDPKKLCYNSIYEENHINLDDDDFIDSYSANYGDGKRFYMHCGIGSDYDSEVSTSASDDSIKLKPKKQRKFYHSSVDTILFRGRKIKSRQRYSPWFV